ncbi:millepora cytotoxin-1-like [Acropora muricata]|uniref:millepora cytotoxin-1-like n=1 Tax=Acropora muricata TaxID=159855 RepID=UPI0034E474D4
MTTKGRKLALLLLLLVGLEILLFTGSDATRWFWPRRRCTSDRPSPLWVNDWRQDFNFKCPNSGGSISVWQSKYKNCLRDRVYYFECKKGPFPYQNKDCSTLHYTNDYNKPLNFKCPHNGVIAGVASTYSASTRDRRFAFQCCLIPGHIAHTCKYETPLNTWHAPLRYVVPNGFYMMGAFSEYSKQDRKWQFEICLVTNYG